VDNQARRLKPGFFAKGVIHTKTEEVLAVPESVISTLAGVSNVFVVESNKIRQQQVTLGARQSKLTEITSGLKGDEVLASTNLSQLATGVLVELIPSKQTDDLDRGVPAGPAETTQPQKGREQRPAVGKKGWPQDSSDSGSGPMAATLIPQGGLQ